ncbi:MAG: type II secretion system secretin GspD, partial [Deltaproteobacteria bacterium]|nr:type II secretion system secretin GspD [Deltaproteobacteria bacterium]
MTHSRTSWAFVGLAVVIMAGISGGAYGQKKLPPPAPPKGTVLPAPSKPAGAASHGAESAPKTVKKTAKKKSSAHGANTVVLPTKKTSFPPPQIPGQLPATSAGKGASIPGGKKSATVKPAVPTKKNDGALDVLEDVVTFKSNFEKDVKCVPLPLNAKISVDFEEAPLYDVIKFMACITQRNYIMASKVKGGKTVTIMSTTPVTVYEAYKAFLSALDINQMTVVPTGKFYKIIDSAKAKQSVLPLYGDKEAVPAEDRPITRIVTLKNIEVQDIEQVLAKFKTSAGDITSYKPGNSLIITDLGGNVVRMLKFVKELDVPTGREKIWVRPVQYAAAADMASLVTTLFGEKGGKAPRRSTPHRPGRRGAKSSASVTSVGEGPATLSKLIADERTNSLIIVATPAAYLKIDRLLRRVDVPIEGEGQIHIYRLENADAEDVAQTLSSLTSGGGRRGKARKGAKAGGAASLFEGEVKITAHKPTNSLVIESTLKDYIAIKKVISQIDIRRKQVYVEAVIMEISVNKDRKVGISASGGTSFNIGGNQVPLMLGYGGLGISGFDMQQLTKGGMAVGLQGPLVDVSTGTTGDSATSGALAIPSYGFMIQALQSNSDVNVLSTPHILTMDNEEAEIVVGKQIPYQASSGYGGLSSLAGLSGLAGGSSRNSSSALSSLGGLGGYGGYGGFGGYVQRIDVDLTLKITPQISESNFVRLEIEQSIDDVESLDPTLGPTTSKRKVT